MSCWAATRCRTGGIDDRWPVVCEPYTQWVLQDAFGYVRSRRMASADSSVLLRKPTAGLPAMSSA